MIVRPSRLLDSINRGFTPKSIPSLLTWHFAKGATLSGDIIFDKAGNETRTVQPGRCYLFDGVDDYVTCGDIGNSLTTLSCFAWIKTTASATDYVLSRYETLSNQRSFFIGVNTTGVLDVFLSEDGQYANSSKIYESTTVVNDGDWHHVGFTWGSGSLKVYIDGLEATVTKTQDDIFTEIHDSTNPFLIGAIRTGIENFDGSIYGLQVFNNTLSSSDVSRLYADITDYDTAPIGYWKCDEGGGLNSYDSSGNENHGTITNPTLSTFHSSDVGVNKSWQNDVGYGWIGDCRNNYWRIEESIRPPQSGDLWEIVVSEYENPTSAASAFIGNYALSDNLHASLYTNFPLSGETSVGINFLTNSPINLLFVCPYDLRQYNDFMIKIAFEDTEVVCDFIDADGNILATDTDSVTSYLSTSSTSITDMFGATAQAGSPARRFKGSLRSVRMKWDDNDETWTFNDTGSGTIKSNNGLAATSESGSRVYNIQVPRDEVNTPNDALGYPLQNSGRVKYNLDLVNSHCATFDGVDDEIDFGNPSQVQFQPDEPFSIAFWIDISGVSNGNYSMLRYSDGSSSFRGYRISINRSTGVVTFRLAGASRTSQWDSTSGAISFTSSSKSIVLVYDPSITDGSGRAQVRIYADGEFIENMSASGSLDTGQTVSYSGLTFKLGETAPFQVPFAGVLHNFSVHSDNLTADEISSMYSGGFVDDNLSLYVPMAEGAASVVYDASGNENHGAIINATLSTFWGGTQDVYHYNLTQGFSSYSGFEQAGGSRIDIDSGSINLGVNNTFNIWMKWNQNECTIVGNSGGYIFSLRPFGPYSFYAQTGSGGQAVLFSDTSMEDGKLHMVTMVREDEDFRLYIDGVFSETISEPLNGGLDTLFNHLSIAGVTRTYNGLLIDASFFDVALSPSEVAEAYNGGKLMDMSSHTQSANLIAQMRDNGDGTYTDLTGTYTPTYSGTLYPMKAPKGFSSLGVTNPSFYGHNDAETDFKQQAVAPAIRNVDISFSTPFWYNGPTINEKTYDDFPFDYEDAGKLFSNRIQENKRFDLLMFDEELTGGDYTNVRELIGVLASLYLLDGNGRPILDGDGELIGV